MTLYFHTEISTWLSTGFRLRGPGFFYTCHQAIKSSESFMLPKSLHGILLYQFIGSQNRKMMHNRLANQHSIKRIFMQQRKAAQVQSGFFIELQRINAMLLTLERNEPSRRL